MTSALISKSVRLEVKVLPYQSSSAMTDSSTKAVIHSFYSKSVRPECKQQQQQHRVTRPSQTDGCLSSQLHQRLWGKNEVLPVTNDNFMSMTHSKTASHSLYIKATASTEALQYLNLTRCLFCLYSEYMSEQPALIHESCSRSRAADGQMCPRCCWISEKSQFSFSVAALRCPVQL